MSTRVVVADDQEIVRTGLTMILRRATGLGVRNRVEIAIWAYETGRVGRTKG